MINFQAPAPAYMLRQNGQTVFAQPAGGAIFTSPMYPSRRGGMNGLGSLSVQPQRTVLEMDTGFTVSDPNCGVLNVAVLPGESNQQAYERTKAAWAAKYGHLVPASNESEQQARCRMEIAYRQAQANAQQLALHQQHGTMFTPQSAPAPALVDPAWQRDLYIKPSFSPAQPMMFTDAQMLQAQQMAAGAGSGMQIVNTSPSLAPSPASLSPVAPFQPFAAPIQHSDPMAAAREEIAQREAEAAGILFDRPIDGGDVLARLAKEKYEREAQQRHQAFLAQEAAAGEARRRYGQTAPPVAQSNTLLWVGLGAAAFGVAWWMMSGKGAAA